MKGVRRERDVTGMPDLPLPVPTDTELMLPELVGQLTILPGDGLR